MAYLVVRIRGTVNIPSFATATLRYLNLTKKYRATLLPENAQYLGMLRKVKNIVAWTVADPKIIVELLQKRARKPGQNHGSDFDLPHGFDSIEPLALAISENRLSMSDIPGLKPWFPLHPPRGGFKRKTKTQYKEGGVLGEDKLLIDLVRKML
jgi:large subunit ribosomal protein L30